MINDLLINLKNNLNAHLSSGRRPQDPQEDPVVFLEGQTGDSLSFKLGAVSVLLVKLEQENILRSPDLYERRLPEGTVQIVQPEIRLNLYALFVAHYPQYEDALRNLSAIIQYFQGHRLINQHTSPGLSDKIDQVVMELVTLSFSEQNEMWGALRAAYQPSVLYKAKMVVFQDQGAAAEAPAIAEQVLTLPV
jgi:hypothetical protein